MKTIVIIDDYLPCLELMTEYIRMCSDGEMYNVYTFNNTKAGIDFINDHHIDLLFQDIHVDGDADGLVSAKIAKDLGIPVVMITGDMSIDIMTKMAQCEYSQYIIKPITLQNVNQAINKFIHKIPELS